LGEPATLTDAAFVKHLRGGLARGEWPKHTLRVIKRC